MGEPTGGDASRHPARVQALVATWRRWATGTVIEAVGLAAATQACLGFVGAHRSLGSMAGTIGLAATAGSVLLAWTLRAEESRLTRDLRLARVGSSAVRESRLARRERAPFFVRWLSTQLGHAAILVAEGDVAGATSVLEEAPVMSRGGRVEALRAVVEADLERAKGTPSARAECIARLSAAQPLHHREADLYRLHVLTKAVLEQGDAEAADELAPRLATSTDDDERLYAIWLRVWFDLDATPASGGRRDEASAAPWPALVEGDVRVALLNARAQGATALVAKLEERLVAIARPGPRG